MSEPIDCHGRDASGCDDENFWMGTENAWYILGDEDTSGCDDDGTPNGLPDGPDHPPATPTFYEVSGKFQNLDFQGYFLASNEERVRKVLDTFFVRDVTILTSTLAANPNVTYQTLREGYLFVDDEESARLQGTLYAHKPVVEQETYPHGPKKG